jgi:hypothetical protein
MVIVDTSGSMTSSTGSGNNSCGQPRRRINDAKCVLQRVVNGYGDAVFGLERFRQSCSGTCSSCGGGTCGCTCSLTCTTTSASGEVLVPIRSDNQRDILEWLNYTCTSCGSTAPGTNPELVAIGNTPLAGALLAARDYFAGPTSPLLGDPAGTCRPVSVILLTDGNETCRGDPPAAARALRSTLVGGRTYDIRTYVIGFGVPAGDADIEAIATAGGTDAPGPYRGFYASDETTLAAAFSDIIASSFRFEVCNGTDDDCDGRIDEGFTLYCNRPAGISTPRLCTDPGESRCDGIDDNCNGMIDEGVRNACGTCGPPPAEMCNRVDDDCDGAIDEGGVCRGCVPSAEICDGLDNDCDGVVDGIRRPCGTDVGECTLGTQLCTSGSWGPCDGVGPRPEVCDGLDNDCDGVTDGLVEMCGSSVGECRPGSRICTGGRFGPCMGSIDPVPERCDGRDNDCDGAVDEGDPESGVPCGDDTGECRPGVARCVGGMLVCEGAVGPTMEVCNGRDDDCDGAVDDEIPVGAACGSDVGECSPGVFVCDSATGMLVCSGEIGPRPEVCNLLDDDCDGRVDEMLEDGGPCGTDVGVCMTGSRRCVAGTDVCVGEVPPSPEVCDCEDNDCDGETDEPPAGGSLCPMGSACIECQCALPCMEGEFGFICPTGRTPAMQDGRCYCVADRCDEAECASRTIERGGVVLCGPDRRDVAPCTCVRNECTFPCDGVVCSAGLVCHPRDPMGRCVEDNCRGLGCPEGQICDRTSGACVEDPCRSVTCMPGEACRAGRCERSCAGVDCPRGERCRAGRCEPDPCAAVSCGAGEFCDPTAGACVSDRCVGVTCPLGTVCERSTGACTADPCEGLRCPEGQRCVDGECEVATGRPDGGVTGGGRRTDGGGDPERRVLASGGGGCLCAAPGMPADRRAPIVLVAFLVAAWSAVLRRRSGRGGDR